MNRFGSRCMNGLKSSWPRTQSCSTSTIRGTRCKRVYCRNLSTLNSPQRDFGQAFNLTHPHLIRPGEGKAQLTSLYIQLMYQVTPGISATEYELRRTLLMQKVPKDSLIFVVGSGTRYMRGVAFFEFRQNANMFYLTGINEPDTAMILRSDDSAKGYSMHLFMQPKDEFDESWLGYRTGLAAAQSIFGADEVLEFDAFSKIARQMKSSASTIYADLKDGAEMSGSCVSELATALDGSTVKGLSALLHRLRLVKSEAEIALMRRVGQISGRVYNDAMKQAWKNEADLQAELRHGWIRHGGEREAYVPVVAAGDRAACIHYTQNNRAIAPNDMIFVDAGAELGGYLTDISRAWPSSGKFTEPQRDLYQAVLNVEKACVKMCTSDSGHSIQTIHMESIELMKQELRNLGFNLVEGDVERYLYPHRVGHHIGLEIHDCSSMGGFESLKENQTITIEPGCYVPHDEQWPKHFRGIALRVEDSIAVGKTVPTVLSVEAVKEIVDIEALRR